jgi:tetratricopeptide (TPR) repeat protein
MRTKFIIAGVLAIAGLAFGQKPKSKAEVEAVNAMISAQAPDDKIKAVDALLAKYKDTEFKAAALEQAGEAYEQKGDAVNAIIYGNRSLEADPKYYLAMLLVARQTAQSTHENDLDKDDKIKRTTKMANDAVAALNAAPKINPQMTDDQWTGVKKELIAQAHSSLGVVAVADKKFDAAINEFKTSLDNSPDPVTMIRLGNTYNRANKPDDAIAALDKALASPGLQDAVKKFATEEKNVSLKLKAAKK